MKFYTIAGCLLALVGAMQCNDLKAAAQEEQAQSGITWVTDFEAAKKQANEQNKPIFLFFTGSDWCPWCMKMDANILSTPDFAKLVSDKIIFMKVDDPRKIKLDSKTEKQNAKLRDEFGIRGYPQIILLDSSGKKITSTPLGYKDMRQDPRYKDSSMGEAYAQMVLDVISAYNKK